MKTWQLQIQVAIMSQAICQILPTCQTRSVFLTGALQETGEQRDGLQLHDVIGNDVILLFVHFFLKYMHIAYSQHAPQVLNLRSYACTSLMSDRLQTTSPVYTYMDIDSNSWTHCKSIKKIKQNLQIWIGKRLCRRNTWPTNGRQVP